MFDRFKEYIQDTETQPQERAATQFRITFGVDAADEKQAMTIKNKIEDGLRDLDIIDDFWMEKLSSKGTRGGFRIGAHIALRESASEATVEEAANRMLSTLYGVTASEPSSIDIVDVTAEG